VKFAVVLTNFGTYSDPRAAVRVAQAAEAAGWDGFFVWDHLSFVWGPPSADPWTTLAAVAASTKGLTLGTAITPVPRRRPQVLAQQVSTVDALNEGGVVLGAGLGGNKKEFVEFGEDFDPHRRAALLDEGLDLVRSLWPGPVWIGGDTDAMLRRAASWDGWIANSARLERMVMTPEQLAAKVRRIGRGAGFEVACNGYSTAADGDLVHAYADAGATWWFETFHDARFDVERVLARVEEGIPLFEE
jgi:alkanesulfonate monooxygenase SsuD/methylene tetrahydromethanopterin reductase-like flavin-dependent oxidoreductase (luciferase family)